MIERLHKLVSLLIVAGVIHVGIFVAAAYAKQKDGLPELSNALQQVVDGLCGGDPANCQTVKGPAGPQGEPVDLMVQRAENLCVFDDASAMGDPEGDGILWQCSVDCPAGTFVIGGGCAMGLSNPTIGGDVSLVNNNCEPTGDGASWTFELRFNSENDGRGLAMRVKAICAVTGE